MVLFKEELLTNLVKHLAYPILIFSCFYFVKTPLIKLLEHRFTIKPKLKNIELKLPPELIQSVFDGQRVTKEKYLSLVYMTGSSYLALAYVRDDKQFFLDIADQCITYLQTNNYDPTITDDLKQKRDNLLKTVAPKE
jgi:hypothetical protein